MGRRSANILLPAVIIPVVACVVIALMLWVLAPNSTETGLAPAPAAVAGPTTVAAVEGITENVQNLTGPQTENGAAQSAAETIIIDIEQERIALYERVAPAVVSIDISNVDFNQLDDVDPTTIEQGQGSGFVIDKEGHIVTNNHVVAGAKTIEVLFADRRRAAAQVIGTDENSDLAVIKVEPEFVADIMPLSIGDSTTLLVGQDVYAIGSPFGLQNTMTRGIVSATKGRSLPGATTSLGRFSNTNIIQTDAAINPGNSGGPLLNRQGEVVGINTAIRVSPGTLAPSFEGVGFAVPSSTIMAVVPDLIEYGKHAYAYLGVSMFDVTPQLAAAYDLPVKQGVLITRVVEGSAADQAGLRAGDTFEQLGSELLGTNGDIVIAIDGSPVVEVNDLLTVINDSQVGQTVVLTVQRGSQTIELDVTLGERPSGS